jgi:excisionase family DNA binding protein
MAATGTKQKNSRSRLNGATDTNQVLTLSEAAAFLRVPEEALLRSAMMQEVPGRKIGDDWRFSKAALENWLDVVPKRGLLSQIGALKDDPHREDLLREIYARRGRPETQGR